MWDISFSLYNFIAATFLFILIISFLNTKAAGGCPAALRPGRWLDLYSGTGSVGIEALSRGCSEVLMFSVTSLHSL